MKRNLQGSKPIPTAQRIERLYRLSLRGLACLVVLWGGFSVGRVLTDRQSATTGVTQPSVLSADIAFPLSPFATPAAGVWSMGDLPWSVEVAQVLDDDVAKFMESLPLDQAADDSLNTLHDFSLLESLKSICTRVEQREAHTVYSADQPTLRLRLYSRVVDGREVMVAGCAAYPRSGKQWTVITATPGPEQRGGQSGWDHLVPLPDSATTVFCRRSRDGRLQCEVVSLACELTHLTSVWRDSGWMVESPPWADGRSGILHCSRGGSKVHVRVMERESAKKQSILVILDINSITSHEDQWVEVKERVS